MQLCTNQYLLLLGGRPADESRRQLHPRHTTTTRIRFNSCCEPRQDQMAQFTVNPGRPDPYKNFNFRVKWDGKYIAGITRVSALKRTTEVIEYREGADRSTSHKLPGITKYEPITLERGVTHDTEFEEWANSVWNLRAELGSEVSFKDFRKDIIIQFYNEAGQLVIAYKVYRCWVSEFQALPELDADAGTVAFQRITLENEGWERDTDIQEPAEPASKADAC